MKAAREEKLSNKRVIFVHLIFSFLAFLKFNNREHVKKAKEIPAIETH